jgi:hypothetical protein
MKLKKMLTDQQRKKDVAKISSSALEAYTPKRINFPCVEKLNNTKKTSSSEKVFLLSTSNNTTSVTIKTAILVTNKNAVQMRKKSF